MREYRNFRDELTVAKGLVLKGTKIVVPKVLRSEMLERIHEGHLGITKSLRKVCEALFWPGMSTAVVQKIENCSVCIEHKPSQQRETLQPHEIPPLPWAKVGTDILHKNGHNYLIIVDYYSKWLELAKVNSVTSSAVIAALKFQFARFGIPLTVISDNGPCYSSSYGNSVSLQMTGGFSQHITSSQGYPKSNGQAERTVKSIKAMLEKAKEPYLAFLAYRNTPLDGVNLSPAQFLMGRRLRSTVPQTTEMSKPESHDPQVVHTSLVDRQMKQYHDKSAKDLGPLKEGETVRVQTEKKWKPARVIEKLVEPRSYRIETEDGEYRRNRKHLLKTGEPARTAETDVDQNPETDVDQKEALPCHLAVPNSPNLKSAGGPNQNPSEPCGEDCFSTSSSEIPTSRVTRSGRAIKMPVRYQDYKICMH